MFTFRDPWLCILLILPLVIWRFFPRKANSQSNNLEKQVPEIIFPYTERLKNSFLNQAKVKKASNRLFFIIISLIWSALVVAIMKPQIADNISYFQNKGYDLILAVDISGSMEALDFSTKETKMSRLDVTKEVVNKFVRQRQGDRIGLILFGQYAYMQSPMTLDTLAVGAMLSSAVCGMAGPTTAIGDAIGLAIKSLRTRAGDSKVIILLTDGEDTASSIPPRTAAEIAKQYGIRIYTIGAGSNGKVAMPDKNGKISMVEVTIDEVLLKDIAEITGGKYFKAKDKNALHDIYNHINTLEKTELVVKEYSLQRPLYRYPLGFAAILILALYIIPLFRRDYGY